MTVSTPGQLVTDSYLILIFFGRFPRSPVIEEYILNGWESRVRDQMSSTLCSFNRRVFHVELSTEEKVDWPIKSHETPYGSL